MKRIKSEKTLNGQIGPCVCGKESIYCIYPDRVFHVDGSENLECWWLMTTGREHIDPQAFGPRHLYRHTAVDQ